MSAGRIGLDGRDPPAWYGAGARQPRERSP